jgi:hypothetical protein
VILAHLPLLKKPFGFILSSVISGISFLLPIFVITLVKEKEERILVMMRMVRNFSAKIFFLFSICCIADIDLRELFVLFLLSERAQENFLLHCPLLALLHPSSDHHGGLHCFRLPFPPRLFH